MSVESTNRTLTGRLTWQPRIVLGHRKDGSPGVTVHVNYDAGYGCYNNPEILEKLIVELQDAVAHLRGEDWREEYQMMNPGAH